MNLFVTVGAQMPFDRLVRAVDTWAAQHPEHTVFAQVGDADYAPRSLEAAAFLPPGDFGARCDGADAIVGHAGTGTLFAALTRGKPVLVMPRRAHLSETRNDHQVATAKHFKTRRGVYVADDESSLSAALDRLVQESAARGSGEPNAPMGRLPASAPLLRAIAQFIDASATTRRG